MAKHRALSWRTSAISMVVIAALAALLTAAIGPQAVGAASVPLPPGKAVVPKNADVLARCALQAMSVDPNNDYATTVKLSAQAQPATAFGYVNNVFTQVFCTVFNSDGDTQLADWNPYVNSATLLAAGKTVVLPYHSSYRLCGRALVKLSNGDSSSTNLVCA